MTNTIKTKWAGLTRGAKRLTVAATVIVLAIALAIAAYALVQARAELAGSVGTGSAELSWTHGNGSPGAIAGEWLTYAAGVPVDNDPAAFPAGVTATATADANGLLTLAIGGLFPGEGVAFVVGMNNGSSLDLESIAFDYNGGIYGPDGDATADVELWLATYNGGGYDPFVFPATVASGADVFSGTTFLMVELSPTALADGGAFSATGVAVVGEGAGGR